MKLPCTIKFVDEKLCNSFYRLEEGNEAEKRIFQFIRKALDEIKTNAFCGIQIPKRQIPQEYAKTYHVTNLWKYNLPRGWRLIYTITREEIIVVSLIIEYFGHKEYEEKFRY